MRFPQVGDRVKEAPAHALRAMFAGIGQVLLVADRMRSRPADREMDQPAAAESLTRTSQPTAAEQLRSPVTPAASNDGSRWRSLDETGNVRILPVEYRTSPAFAPLAAEPEAAEPEAAGPVPAELTLAEPETAGPGTTGPGTTGPETTGPETTGPETTGPETTGPETTGPEPVLAEPDMPGPNLAEPEAEPEAEPRPEAEAEPELVLAEPELVLAEPELVLAEPVLPAPVLAKPGRLDTAKPVELPVPNYDDLSLASLRARLRNLGSAQVLLLLDYETAHAARPAVLAMYERRISKLQTGQG
jgi:hypothetical protein